MIMKEINACDVNIENRNFCVSSIINKETILFKECEYDYSEAYSEIINLILLRCELPTMMGNATTLDGKYMIEVTYGNNIISYLYDFMLDKVPFTCVDIAPFKALDGKYFSEFTRPLQRRIKEFQINIKVSAGRNNEINDYIKMVYGNVLHITNQLGENAIEEEITSNTWKTISKLGAADNKEDIELE